MCELQFKYFFKIYLNCPITVKLLPNSFFIRSQTTIEIRYKASYELCKTIDSLRSYLCNVR